MKVKLSTLYSVFIFMLIFSFSLYLLSYYQGGDQLHYRFFYDNCLSGIMTNTRQFSCYRNNLGSQEFGYFFISKFFHLFFAKDLYISLANAFFSFLITKLIFKSCKTIWSINLILFFILTNYYFWVLLLSAERLKFSFILLTIALLVSNKKKIIFHILSICTHVQIILLAASYYISKILSRDTKIWVKIYVIFGFTFLSCALFIVFKDHIESKVTIYSNIASEKGSGFIGSIKTGFFVLLAGISVKKIMPIICGTPLIIIAYFLGSERIGILAFVLYLFSILYYKKKMDLPLFIIMLYFSLKCIGFISNVMVYGNGFYL